MENHNEPVNKLIKVLGFSFFVLLLTGGTAFLQLPKLKQGNQQLTAASYKQQEQAERNRLAFLKKVPSFGYDNLIADWIYLNFIQYYGDNPARQITGYTLSPEYFEQVVERDPRFIESYLYLAPATSLFAGRPDRSVDLIAQGAKFVHPKQPLSYQLWTYKAGDQLLFLGDIPGAIKSYEMAAKWASLFPDEFSQYVAKSSLESVKFLQTNPDSSLARASAWVTVLTNARDEQTRELAVKKIKETGGELIISPTGISVRIPPDKKK